MSAVYLTFVAVLLAGLGARDQVTVAGLSLRQGARPAVLLVAGVLAIGTAAFAAWAASVIAPDMLPPARLFLVAIALALAGLESLLLAPRPTPSEPTHSLFATAIVLLSHQLTDAARFLVFGVAVATNVPVPAAIGGAMGGIALIAGAWAFPEVFTHRLTRIVRRVIGGMLLMLAIYLGLRATGRL